jgi:Tfp pilus assembly protein PilF
LNDIPQRSEESVDLRLLRGTAYAAMGNYRDAMEQCQMALKKEPNDSRVRLRMARLEQQAAAEKAAR